MSVATASRLEDPLLRSKRRKSSSNVNLNRSSSSPVIAPKWRADSAAFKQRPNPISSNEGGGGSSTNTCQTSSNFTSSKSSISLNTQSTGPSPNTNNTLLKQNSIILDLNRQMRSNQQKLSQIIRQADSNQPSYHVSSKLYRPSSFLIANSNALKAGAFKSNNLHVQTLPNKTNLKKTKELMSKQHHHHNHLKVNTQFVSSDQLLNGRQKQAKLGSPAKTVQISPDCVNNAKSGKQFYSAQSNNATAAAAAGKLKIPVTSKIKRKIFETITNKVNSSNHNLNHKNASVN